MILKQQIKFVSSLHRQEKMRPGISMKSLDITIECIKCNCWYLVRDQISYLDKHIAEKKPFMNGIKRD